MKAEPIPQDFSLDAAQRTIEDDSFLMDCYRKTPDNLTISGRIKEVWKSQIRHDPIAYAKYLEIKKMIEAQNE